MAGKISGTQHFKSRIRELLRRSWSSCRVLKIKRHQPVYTSGQPGTNVYFVESGRIKLVSGSTEGKQCLISIRNAGDLFGELCLSGRVARTETAVAMENSAVRPIACHDFLARLRHDSLVEAFLEYMAESLAEQQKVIAMLVTANSEQRLARTLLNLCRAMGGSHPGGIRIEQRISQQELGEMVGTTRTRIGVFLKKFQKLGLVSTSAGRRLIVHQEPMRTYLMRAPAEKSRVEKVRKRRARKSHPPHITSNAGRLPRRKQLRFAHRGKSKK